MLRRKITDEETLLRGGLALLAAVLLASAALAFDSARTHMALLSSLCGGADAPHCGWCYAAAGFVVMGAVALFAALRPARAKACA